MMTLQDRLNAYTRRIPESGCWVWVGATNQDGYGRVSVKGKNKHAHRVSYELANGAVPQGLVLDHLCRVRCCVNPAHLEPVTLRENIARGDHVAKGRFKREMTSCKNGHEYTSENTYWRDGGYLGQRKWRVCKVCHNAQRSKN